MATGRPRKIRTQRVQAQAALPTVPSAPSDVASSLPPAPTDQPQVSSVSSEVSETSDIVRTNPEVEQPWGPGPKPSWWLPPDSKTRKTALLILAMRLAGMPDDEIAKRVKLGKESLRMYLYLAGKNGWLDIDKANSAKDAVDFNLLPKVVRNLYEGLDGTGILNNGMRERTHVALKIAEGTIFKEYGEQRADVVAQTMVAIRIEMPQGPPQQVREGTLGGTPSFIEGEVSRGEAKA